MYPKDFMHKRIFRLEKTLILNMSLRTVQAKNNLIYYHLFLYKINLASKTLCELRIQYSHCITVRGVLQYYKYQYLRGHRKDRLINL